VPNPPRQIHARAHAKLNLALGVGAAIPPGSPNAGFHPVASWMHAVGLADEITLTIRGSTEYDLARADGSPVGWDPDADLGVRAHRAVERLAGRELPVHLRVRKHVPDAGGLGGGSADAAGVLLALRDLFALDLDDAALVHTAHALGSDVPYFLDTLAWQAEQPPRPAVVLGLGERVERMERRSDPLTLVVPPFGCQTGAVYRAFDEANDRPTPPADERRVRELARAGAPAEAALFNDLAAAAERTEPRLATLRRTLAGALGAPVHLSGSGSTLFCFADAEAVRPHAEGCRVIATRLV
jgi:4-diphosphocytidyl-2-C-methyl-D-erythritol kinase